MKTAIWLALGVTTLILAFLGGPAAIHSANLWHKQRQAEGIVEMLRSPSNRAGKLAAIRAIPMVLEGSPLAVWQRALPPLGEVLVRETQDDELVLASLKVLEETDWSTHVDPQALVGLLGHPNAEIAHRSIRQIKQYLHGVHPPPDGNPVYGALLLKALDGKAETRTRIRAMLCLCAYQECRMDGPQARTWIESHQSLNSLVYAWCGCTHGRWILQIRYAGSPERPLPPETRIALEQGLPGFELSKTESVLVSAMDSLKLEVEASGTELLLREPPR